VSTRAELVAALSTVPGLSVTPTQPGSIVAGAAWPVWRQTVWRNQVPDGARALTWFVFVALGSADLESTVLEADPLVELVGDALIGAELGVQLVEPVRITVNGSADGVPALRYSLGDR
jgi:hypothetical protein